MRSGGVQLELPEFEFTLVWPTEEQEEEEDQQEVAEVVEVVEEVEEVEVVEVVEEVEMVEVAEEVEEDEEDEVDQEDQEEAAGMLRGSRLDSDIREEEEEDREKKGWLEDWEQQDTLWREGYDSGEEDILQAKDMLRLLLSDMQRMKSDITLLLAEVALLRKAPR
ncbi:hypothetical protein HDU78_006038 [Chytriomyces hyalinus]|nr:hypothetical protein HDU78_006038 [Chytriomyces hyalinus]